jgi:hypothetical protein
VGYSSLYGSRITDFSHRLLALWGYADQSAKVIFGAEPEDPLPGLVLAKLREASAGLTKTELHGAFGRNLPPGQLLAALAKLRDRGAAYEETVPAGGPGRPAARWRVRTNEIIQTPPESPGVGINSFVRSPAPGQGGATAGEVVVL